MEYDENAAIACMVHAMCDPANFRRLIAWLQAQGLLATKPACHTCCSPMIQHGCKSRLDGFVWSVQVTLQFWLSDIQIADVYFTNTPFMCLQNVLISTSYC
jgi:hypothetical protein